MGLVGLKGVTVKLVVAENSEPLGPAAKVVVAENSWPVRPTANYVVRKTAGL